MLECREVLIPSLPLTIAPVLACNGSPWKEQLAVLPGPQALPRVRTPAGGLLTSLLALFPNVFLTVTLSLQLLFVIELNVIAMDETELHKQGEMLSFLKTQLKDTI